MSSRTSVLDISAILIEIIIEKQFLFGFCCGNVIDGQIGILGYGIYAEGCIPQANLIHLTLEATSLCPDGNLSEGRHTGGQPGGRGVDKQSITIEFHHSVAKGNGIMMPLSGDDILLQGGGCLLTQSNTQCTTYGDGCGELCRGRREAHTALTRLWTHPPVQRESR